APQLTFVGHSHVPGIFFESRKYIAPVNNEPFEIPTNEKIIINVGSVGQPRDYDNRACWVEVDGRRVTHHRVPYNFHQTYEKVRSTRMLHISLGARLIIGV
ncbi:MAG: metallophosphoesterase, partial [Planctomycetota bacterium]